VYYTPVSTSCQHFFYLLPPRVYRLLLIKASGANVGKQNFQQSACLQGFMTITSIFWIETIIAPWLSAPVKGGVFRCQDISNIYAQSYFNPCFSNGRTPRKRSKHLTVGDFHLVFIPAFSRQKNGTLTAITGQESLLFLSNR